MRELKFRAWDKQTKDMLEFFAPSMEFYNKRLHRYRDFFDRHIIRMQFTGLKDKNGVEIYEGDIVRIWGGEYCQGYWEVDEIGEVVFEEYSFGTKSNGRFHPFNIAFEPYDLEIKVIGNIFEHPHLLEVKGNE